MAEHITQPTTTKHTLFLIFSSLGMLLLLALIMGLSLLTFTTQTSPQTPPISHVGSSPLLVITNSGSTNLPGLSLTINKDGSGLLHFDQGRNQLKKNKDRTFAVGTFNTTKVRSVLSQIQDMNKVPQHSCLKSISFGSTTTITYNDKTSGDISCLTQQDGLVFNQLRLLIQGLYNTYTQTQM